MSSGFTKKGKKERPSDLPKDGPEHERKNSFESEVNFLRETVGHGLQSEHEALQRQDSVEHTCRARGDHVADVAVVRTPRVVHRQRARDAVCGDQAGVGGIVPRLFRQHHEHRVVRHGAEHEFECHQHQPQCH